MLLHSNLHDHPLPQAGHCLIQLDMVQNWFSLQCGPLPKGPQLPFSAEPLYINWRMAAYGLLRIHPPIKHSFLTEKSSGYMTGMNIYTSRVCHASHPSLKLNMGAKHTVQVQKKIEAGCNPNRHDKLFPETGISPYSWPRASFGASNRVGVSRACMRQKPERSALSSVSPKIRACKARTWVRHFALQTIVEFDAAKFGV